MMIQKIAGQISNNEEWIKKWKQKRNFMSKYIAEIKEAVEKKKL